MKKIILSLVFLFCAGLAFADVPNLQTQTVFSGSGGGTATINIDYKANTSIAIYNIDATSDLAGSVVTISRGAATGSTGNYTVVGTLAVGAASISKYNNGLPIFIFPKNYQGRLLLNCTTAKSLIVTYGRIGGN